MGTWAKININVFRRFYLFQPKFGFCYQRSEQMSTPNMNGTNYTNIQMSGDKSSFRVFLPGWGLEDINIIANDLYQPHYLRLFRVLNKWEQLRELAKPLGFFSLNEFEQTHDTYMKCVDLERKVSAEYLRDLGRKPYSYDIISESKAGKIGKSSFQIDNLMKEASTQQELFRGSLVYVCVDKDTKLPTNNPTSWTNRFQEASKNAEFQPLRVSLKNPAGSLHILHRTDFLIRPSEVDRFGHTNNTALNNICADAILETLKERKIPSVPTVEFLEGNVRRIMVDFIGGSGSGDCITAEVAVDSAQPNKLLCRLYNKEKLIYAQALEYDKNITSSGKL